MRGFRITLVGFAAALLAAVAYLLAGLIAVAWMDYRIRRSASGGLGAVVSADSLQLVDALQLLLVMLAGFVGGCWWKARRMRRAISLC